MSTTASITANPQILPPITVSALSGSNFLTKWFHAFVDFFKRAPNWVHVAQTVLPFAVLVANGILSAVAEELLVIALPIEAEVQADLTTVAVLTKKGTSTPSLTDAIDRIKANFNGMAEALHIKNEATLQQIATVVTQLDLLLNIVAPPVPVDAGREKQ